MRINKKLVKPLVEEDYGDSEYVDMRFLPVAILLSVGAIILALLLSIVAYDIGKWLLRKPGPPPKVITRVIKQSAFNEAQRKFIDDCERNTREGDGDYKQAVPDVHTTVWTCKMP